VLGGHCARRWRQSNYTAYTPAFAVCLKEMLGRTTASLRLWSKAAGRRRNAKEKILKAISTSARASPDLARIPCDLNDRERVVVVSPSAEKYADALSAREEKYVWKLRS